MTAAAGELLAGVRRYCLELPEVTEAPTHGAPTWFVRRRSFAKFVDPADHRLDQTSIALWAAAPPGARAELIAAAPDRFSAPRFGGHDWVAIRLEGADWDEVREIVTDAYRQVAPKRLVARLDA
jgi:hypothetical protein